MVGFNSPSYFAKCFQTAIWVFTQRFFLRSWIFEMIVHFSIHLFCCTAEIWVMFALFLIRDKNTGINFKINLNLK